MRKFPLGGFYFIIIHATRSSAKSGGGGVEEISVSEIGKEELLKE